MLLSDLADVLSVRVLLYLDERALGALSGGSRHFGGLASDPAIWRHLALHRDARAAEQASRGLFGAGPADWRHICRELNACTATLVWPPGESPAVPAAPGQWDDLLDGGGPDAGGSPATTAAAAAAEGAREGIWGGQSPHLFWLGGRNLLGVAGGYYAENMGGAEVRPLHDVFLFELPPLPPAAEGSAGASPASSCSSPGTGRGPTRIQRLLPGVADHPAGAGNGHGHGHGHDRGGGDGADGYRGHPQVHGAASDFDLQGQRAIFFAGGSPHGQLTDALSALSVRLGSGDRPADARWEPITTVGEKPSARQGARGVLFEGRFTIFGGRELGGGCLNDVWQVDLEAPAHQRMWHRPVCEGRAPSRRVWYAACHAVYGKWIVLGGSEWQFEEPARPHDYARIFVLDLREMRWSALAPPEPALAIPSPDAWLPPWLVASALVPLGGRQLMYLGGSLPHRVGPDGLSNQSMPRWRDWYARLDRPLLLDTKTGRWGKREALLGVLGGAAANPEEQASEILLRSHLAAAYVPERGSVVVFGGSRYFTGEYFHDLLELRLPQPGADAPAEPPAAAGSGAVAVTRLGWPRQRRRPARAASGGPRRAAEELPSGLPRFMLPADVGGRGSRLTRGLRGRLRGMVRDGLLDPAHYQRILANF